MLDSAVLQFFERVNLRNFIHSFVRSVNLQRENDRRCVGYNGVLFLSARQTVAHTVSARHCFTSYQCGVGLHGVTLIESFYSSVIRHRALTFDATMSIACGVSISEYQSHVETMKWIGRTSAQLRLRAKTYSDRDWCERMRIAVFFGKVKNEMRSLRSRFITGIAHTSVLAVFDSTSR